MRLLNIFIFLCFVSISFGQASLANYSVARNTGIGYTSIVSTGSAFDSWRNTVSFTQDDNRSDFTDIGFDFWYNGTRYTQFSVSTNGFLDFSSSTLDGGPSGTDYSYDNTYFTANGSGTWLALAPFYDDMTAQGGTDALGNSIKYLLSGSAPNRVLTVEWINMAVYGNTTPDLNFQVKLYETTGIIEFNYGTMIAGTHGFSYTCGINAATLANTPTVAQLKAQRFANTNTFNNTQTNNLATLPASNSQIVFTPPTPTAAAGALTFSAVTQTGMTLNWPNWATNETGYVIYNSTDNVNFSFVNQSAINATSLAVTGLLPGTTYYWRLYAVAEGYLSASLNGTQATLAAGNKVSNASGAWNTPGIWTPAGVPTTADNVTISNTHTVTIDVNAVCNNLIVGVSSPATLLVGNNNTARTINVANSITINTGSTFSIPTTSNATHLITVNGNIVNNGTINFASDANSLCNATFQKNGNITVSGTGATTTFNRITLNMGTLLANTVEITTPTFVAASNYLTLTTGTFKLSTTGASASTPYSAAGNIPLKGALWLNSALSTMTIGDGTTIFGELNVSNGTLNAGNAANEDLLSNGGKLTISGGTLNIAGKYYSVGINNLSKFTMTGGTVIVPSVGSTNTTIAPFQIAGTGSQFNMTGGTLIIPREGGTGAQNLGFVNTGATGGIVTGGVLQIGSGVSPAGQLIQINTTYPIGGLSVSSPNVTATLLGNPITVVNDVTINSGTLTANSQNFFVGGNWTNNAAAANFVPGTATVTFNGVGTQSINGTAASQTFNNLTNAKTAGSLLNTGGSTVAVTVNNYTQTSGNFAAPATFNVNASATSALVITAGTMTAGATTNVTGNWTNNAAAANFSGGTGTVNFTGTAAQQINGTATAQVFNHLVVAKTAGTLLSCGGSTIALTTNNYTQTTGNFTAPATFNVTFGTASNILLTSGTFTSGTQINLTGNWTNNGATFTPGTGTTSFTGTTAQTIFKTGGETFNNVIFSNAGVKTLNSPIIANGGFTINTGSTFDVNAANHLVTIRGNFLNNGTLTTRNGNIFLNGTLAQTIGGTTITDFYDLTLNNAAGASLLQDENIVNALVLNGGIFNVNARNLTLVSTATGSGRIAQITGTGDISGNVIVQRYAPGGFTGWAFLGAPVTSALTYADWDDDIAISCNSCPDGSANGFESIYYYDETVSGLYDAPASYVALTTINDPIVNGRGYWVYLGDGFTTTNNITLDVTGAPRKFNYTVPLNYTNTGAPTEDGWNLISNPYPSPILWTALRGATAGIDNAIYVYNADLSGGAGSYATFVNGISSPAVGSGGIDNNIPICQGFYVHSTGATSLSAQESNKIGGNPTFLRQNPYNTNSINTQPPPLIRLYLDGLGTYHDETVLYLQDNANNSFDAEYDSYKLVGSDPLAPRIALRHDTNDFQINGVAPITGNFSMPLKAITGYAGAFTISAGNISSFPAGGCISLYDNYTGITTDLRNDTYAFTLSDTTLSARFTLNITLNPLQVNTSTNDPTCNQPSSGQIIAVGNNSGPWNYHWKDDNGLPIKTSLNKSDPDTLDALSGGVFVLEMNTVGSCDNNTTQFALNGVDVTNASFNSPDSLYLGLGANVSFVNSSTNALLNSWSFGDGFGFSGSIAPDYQYTTNGVYLVMLITESSTGCTDTATRQIVVINDATGIRTNTGEEIIVKTLAENVYLIQQTLFTQQQISAILLDGQGKQINNFGTNRTSELNYHIDMSAFSSGIYYLKLTKEEGEMIIKLIKH